MARAVGKAALISRGAPSVELAGFASAGTTVSALPSANSAVTLFVILKAATPLQAERTPSSLRSDGAAQCRTHGRVQLRIGGGELPQ